MYRSVRAGAVGLSCLLIQPIVASAAVVSYTLDPAQSTLSVAGQLQSPAIPMTQQAPGSLSTTYSGAIEADLGAGTIQMLGGTLTAANSGSWQPDQQGLPGNAPANYGGVLDLTLALVYGAVRGFSIQATSGPEALVGGQFPAPSLEILSGVMDYLVVGLASDAGRQALATGTYANAGAPATLTSDGLTETLTIPVAISGSVPASGLTILIDFTGTLVATRPVPEPASAALVLLGGVFGLRLHRRFPRHSLS